MKYQNSIIDNIRNEYIDEYLECSKKINYTDLTESDGLKKVLYKDLPYTDIKGYPCASDYVAPDGEAYSVEEFCALPKELQKQCELRFYYLPYSHELYVGTTGSGKTTGCVEPQLRAISSQKNKPNIFLTDPKGELFERNAKHLKEQGYKLFLLNFKDLIHSDSWNPLLEIYDTEQEIKKIGRELKMKTGTVPSRLTKIDPPKSYSKDGYLEYKGYAFSDTESYENYTKFEKDFLEAKADSLINQLVNMMIVPQSNTDRSWEYGAQDLLKGLINCLLEESLDSKNGFTGEMMNFRNIQRYYQALKGPILSNESDITFYSHPMIKDKSFKTKAQLSCALNNAPNTMRSYCGVFDNATKDWFQGHIYALTSGNTINLDETCEEPFAIFLITRDYEKSDFLIAGLFIDWVYKVMLERAENHKSNRAMHFLLDEFGNIPKIKDFENKIATSRSRNIWFHLIVQSYQQLDHIYGSDCSTIIRDNCNAQIFLGSQNRETKTIFSNECGKHSIPTLGSKLNLDDNSITEVPLIPVSDLELMTPGQMYIKRLYMPVITSQFIRSYTCAEQGAFKDFLDGKGLSTCTPTRVESYTSDKYNYQNIKEYR